MEMYYSLLPFFITLESIGYVFCHKMGTDFSNNLFLLYKTSFNMKNMATVSVINVMYYSTAFSFSNNVSYFYAFCVVHISA